ncbi:hypothetical protein [Scytonema sp. NUACC26]|uniref:hypothetical protein n=1 Tax=Scytonema sp. NUACC26 TaxID=3140176 RepID=UPI0034DC781F
MVFQILDYEHKLQSTGGNNSEKWYQCPVCGGSKLKVRLQNQAYTCYSGFCNTKDIRSKLGAPMGGTGDYKPVSSDIYVRPIEVGKLKPPISFSTSYEPAKRRILQDRVITNYIYNERCIIERVDYADINNRKECYPKYLSGSIWKYGSHSSFGLFNSRYITSSGTAIICEGEKTADVVSSVTGYITLTPPPFGWSETYIAANLTNPKISNVLYLPDYDEMGRKKASIVQRAAWNVGISCSVFDYGDIPMNDSDDFVDLNERGVNIKELIDTWIR